MDDFVSLRSSDICAFPFPLLLLFYDPCERTGESIPASSANDVSRFDDDEYAPTEVVFFAVVVNPIPKCLTFFVGSNYRIGLYIQPRADEYLILLPFPVVDALW
ncbi:hypothetical protein PIB30_102540 [Stylosanthes scabra]|uniref:Uncharacterized protein n=1 Tax=Stylosanthes scabra TaxID=79078 RepID=A0ABU6UYI5_9FABA|nr:hypothetical protein [Stylosanthes scabra]